jgi:hypothetical protein
MTARSTPSTPSFALSGRHRAGACLGASDMCPIWSDGLREMPFAPRGPLPQAEYEAVYARVPRLTVEVVIASEAGVLLTRRETGPCQGLWHIPGAPSASAKC